jgi:hypothetical protein
MLSQVIASYLISQGCLVMTVFAVSFDSSLVGIWAEKGKVIKADKLN